MHFNSIKKSFPHCHIEQIVSLEKSIDYVLKEDTRVDGPFEFGIRPRMSKQSTEKLTMGKIGNVLEREVADGLTPS